jgi:hypothetical protein
MRYLILLYTYAYARNSNKMTMVTHDAINSKLPLFGATSKIKTPPQKFETPLSTE